MPDDRFDRFQQANLGPEAHLPESLLLNEVAGGGFRKRHGASARRTMRFDFRHPG